MVIGKSTNKYFKAQSLIRRKIETTYEYVPILGEILGYWRAVNRQRAGEEIHLEIATPLEKYDRLYINRKEIKINNSD